MAVALEQEAGKWWDKFYQRNGTAFFKDRHYLDREFPELAQGPVVVFEVSTCTGLFAVIGCSPVWTNSSAALQSPKPAFNTSAGVTVVSHQQTRWQEGFRKDF